MSGITKPLVGVQANCQWPGFRSTQASAASWGKVRLPMLVDRIKDQDPDFLILQELGTHEAAPFFARMGSSWGYSLKGLNCVGWRKPRLDLASTRDKVLSSYGQLARTCATAIVKDAAGNRLQLISSHLAVKASDLGAITAIKARGVQMDEIVRFVNDYADDPPSVLGADLNSRPSDPLPNSPRRVARKFGWVFDADDKTRMVGFSHDAKRGIDAVAVNYGARFAGDVRWFGLGNGSDHDGRRFTITTTKK